MSEKDRSLSGQPEKSASSKVFSPRRISLPFLTSGLFVVMTKVTGQSDEGFDSVAKSAPLHTLLPPEHCVFRVLPSTVSVEFEINSVSDMSTLMSHLAVTCAWSLPTSIL